MSALNNLELHYFTSLKGSTTIGRGEYVRLLLEDAGVNFKYVKYDYGAKWEEKKKELLSQNIRGPTLPYIIADGKYYDKTVPVMRFIAKKLGKYEGANDDEVQRLDAYADMYSDWVVKWVDTYFVSTSEEVMKKHLNDTLPQALKTWNDILSDVTSGPYILGDRISYVDFLLFHMLEDENSTKVNAESYPHLAKFIQAMQTRPNLSKYLASDRN